MSALSLILTDAGLAALVNADNTGTKASPVVSMGVSDQAQAITPATVALTGEIKRLDAVAGQVVADNVIYLNVADQSADAYAVRTIGFYLQDGTLLAAYSQPEVLVEKASAAMGFWDFDAFLHAPLAEAVDFVLTDPAWNNPAAGEGVAGVLRLASQADADAGADHSKAITPKTLKGVIDALTAWVTGQLNNLSTALAGKAALNHNHDAADTTSGVFNHARLPAATTAAPGKVELATSTETQAGVDGGRAVTPSGLKTVLDALTAAFAPVAHTHTAADTTSGVFNVARIPDLVMGKITGLVDALAGKAAVGHTHTAADTTSGVFSVARIPDLVMDKITGLAAALAGKQPLLGFTPLNRAGDTLQGVLDAGAYLRPEHLMPGAPDDVAGWPVNGLYLTRADAADSGAVAINGTLLTVARTQDRGFQLAVDASNNAYLRAIHGSHVGGLSAWTGIWTDRTFNPANKADLSSPAFTGAPTAPTPARGDNSSKLAPTAYVDRAVAPASVAQYRGNSGEQPMHPSSAWAAAELVVLAQAATIAVNLAAGLNFTTTMTGNRALGAPSNAKPGQSGVIQFIQDGAGNRQLTFNAAWKFQLGVKPNLSTSPGARDILVFTVIAGGDVVAQLIKDVK